MLGGLETFDNQIIVGMINLQSQINVKVQTQSDIAEFLNHKLIKLRIKCCAIKCRQYPELLKETWQ